MGGSIGLARQAVSALGADGPSVTRLDQAGVYLRQLGGYEDLPSRPRARVQELVADLTYGGSWVAESLERFAGN